MSSPTKPGTVDRTLSAGLSNGVHRVLSVAKRWDKGQENDGRRKTGSGFGAACTPTDYYDKDVDISYGSTRHQKIDGLQHFYECHSVNEVTLQQEATG